MRVMLGALECQSRTLGLRLVFEIQKHSTNMAIDDLHAVSAHHTEWSTYTATDQNGELATGSKVVLVALVFVFILLFVVTFLKLIRLERQEMQQQKAR
jgi:hypothetical protein